MLKKENKIRMFLISKTNNDLICEPGGTSSGKQTNRHASNQT